MKILLILLLIMSIGCNKQDNKTNSIDEKDEIKESIQDKEENITEDNDLEPINIYLFWGDGCYACYNMKLFFDNLDEKYNKYFNLVKYEIWYNEENYELMNKVRNYLDQNKNSIPFLVIGDEVITGYSEEKSEYILNKIIEEYKNDRYDVMNEVN